MLALNFPRTLVAISLSFLLPRALSQSYNGLAVTPAMGWVCAIPSYWHLLLAFDAVRYLLCCGSQSELTDSKDNWNSFGCDVSEDLLLGTAKKIVTLGLKDAGYDYIILDDCWSTGRYENGSLRPDFTKFPNGMKHVGDQVREDAAIGWNNWRPRRRALILSRSMQWA